MFGKSANIYRAQAPSFMQALQHTLQQWSANPPQPCRSYQINYKDRGQSSIHSSKRNYKRCAVKAENARDPKS